MSSIFQPLVLAQRGRDARLSMVRAGCVLALSAVHLLVRADAGPISTITGEFAAMLPFPATLQSVIERGAIQGYQVSVVRLSSMTEADQAVSLVRRSWGTLAGDTGLLATQNGSWQILSLKEAGRFRTLQLRRSPSGGLEGLLSIWVDPRRWSRPAPNDFKLSSLLPAGASVLRHFHDQDHIGIHRTLVATASGSARWTIEALDARLRAFGFRQELPSRPDRHGRYARLYRSESARLGVTVHSDADHVAIVLHHTEGSQ